MITLISQLKMIVQFPVPDFEMMKQTRFSSFMYKSSKHLDGETYYTHIQYTAHFIHLVIVTQCSINYQIMGK